MDKRKFLQSSSLAWGQPGCTFLSVWFVIVDCVSMVQAQTPPSDLLEAPASPAQAGSTTAGTTDTPLPNNVRVQFLNNAFINNLAYDKAAETRGYNLGLMVSWVEPAFALRLGSIAMPTTAGGPDMAYNFASQHSDQVEMELHPRLLAGHAASPMILRLLAYRNTGTMGRYREAMQARPAGMVPDITTVRRSGAVKYGFGLNFEQGLGDGGATGVFGRVGWLDYQWIRNPGYNRDRGSVSLLGLRLHLLF